MHGFMNVKFKFFFVPAMKAYGSVEIQLHSFLHSTLDGGEWSPSLPCWMSPKCGLDILE
jgi:hypothetical protein